MRLGLFLILMWQPAAAVDSIREVRERGAALESERKWEQAVELYRTALDRIGPEGPPRDRFWLLASIAEIAFERREYGQARGWLREAEGALRGLGPEAPERARLLNARGTLYLVEGNLTAAERELSRAVEISESNGTSADRAASLHNLAAVEMQTGRLPEAATHQAKALALWQEAFGDRHPYVMKAWISLSSVQALCGDWRAAERSLLQVLAVAQPPEALANYAVVLEKLKRGGEAKEIRRRLRLPIPSAAPLADVKAMPYEGTGRRVRTR